LQQLRTLLAGLPEDWLHGTTARAHGAPTVIARYLPHPDFGNSLPA